MTLLEAQLDRSPLQRQHQIATVDLGLGWHLGPCSISSYLVAGEVRLGFLQRPNGPRSGQPLDHPNQARHHQDTLVVSGSVLGPQ